jgi:hypothetical protein
MGHNRPSGAGKEKKTPKAIIQTLVANRSDAYGVAFQPADAWVRFLAGREAYPTSLNDCIQNTLPFP